jgi:hypothetical protein
MNMNNRDYEYIKSKVETIISSIKSVKKEIDNFGGFIEAELEEEFYENIDCAIMALSDSLENIESDEAMMELDERGSKDIEEEE